MRFVFTISTLLFCFSAFAQDSVRTIAGRALQTGVQDGFPLEARFNDPAALASDSAGNIYLADSRNHLIRRISASGAVTTVVTAAAGLNTPSGLAFSSQGLIVSDTGNHVIRRINGDGSTTVIAGSVGQAASEDGAGSTARFDSPLGLAVTTNGIIYVADCGNHLIRAISPDGTVATIAGTAGAWGTSDGNGGAARFNGPIGLALDSNGDLFVSDSNNHLIRKITPNRDVTTFAGVPLESGFVDGHRGAAKFFHPAELTVDQHGTLYVADSMNHAIRKISSEGVVSTVAGLSRTSGSEDGDNGRARLYNPYGVSILPTGQLAITDSYNQTLREALPPTELQITVGRAVLLNWNSIIGKTYQIQIAAPAFDGWMNIAQPVTAKSETSNAVVPSNLGPNLFRIVLLSGENN